jgi:FkbM family methyltransferase
MKYPETERQTDGRVLEYLARLTEQTAGLSQAVDGLRRQLNALAGQLAATEWQIKLQPAGIPVADGRVLTKTLYGTLLYVDANDRLIAPHLLLDRHFEPEVSLYMEKTVQPGDTIIDVGANIGYYACTLGRKVGPTGRIFAFEADPSVWTLLRDNAILNGTFAWTQCRNIAVSAERGSLNFFRRTRYHGNTGIIKNSPEILEGFGDADEPFQVECDTLDSLMTDCDRPIALVKIDVEGSELAVLKGMRSVVDRNPQIKIVLEWALWTIRGAGGTPEEVWALIEGMGLEAFRIAETSALERVDLAQLLHIHFCYLVLRRPMPEPTA